MTSDDEKGMRVSDLFLKKCVLYVSMMRFKRFSRGFFRQTSRFRGHLTSSRENFSIVVSNDVGWVYVVLVSPAHR